MKNIFILLLIIAGQSLFAQNMEVLDASKFERIEEINKDLEKLRKKISKTDRAVLKAEKETVKTNTELGYKTKAQNEVESQINSVKNEMNGHNYLELKEYIVRTKKKNKSLKLAKRQKANLIAKKAARMEKILEEIRLLEEGIFNDEMEIRQNISNIEEKEDVIVINKLDDKANKLNELSKEYSELERAKKKLNSRLKKNQNTIIEQRKEMLAIEKEIEMLVSEKKELTSKEITGVSTS